MARLTLGPTQLLRHTSEVRCGATLLSQMTDSMATLGDLLKSAGLGLTLGTRKRLESELLKLATTPEAARTRLRELGLPLELRQKIEATLQLGDRADDMVLLEPMKVSIHDSGFVRGKREEGSTGLRILCLHGFASNNAITKLQVAYALGLERKHGVSCDMLRSSRTTSVRDGAVDRVTDPKPPAPCSSALVVQPEPPPPALLSQVGTAFEQAAAQQKLYEQRYEEERTVELEKQRRYEHAQYFGTHAVKQVADLEAASPATVYTWFDWPTMPTATSEQRHALHAQLRRVMGAVRAHGPYDGLFGFSQGALLATILSSPLCYEGLFGLDACPWRFVICANAGGTKALSSYGLVGSKSSPPLAQVRVHACTCTTCMHMHAFRVIRACTCMHAPAYAPARPPLHSLRRSLRRHSPFLRTT